MTPNGKTPILDTVDSGLLQTLYYNRARASHPVPCCPHKTLCRAALEQESGMSTSSCGDRQSPGYLQCFS
jgi:hypothetical protein